MLLFASVFAFVLTAVRWSQYFACADSSKPACGSVQLLSLESGSYLGLVWATGGLLALYVGCAVATQLTLSRPHVPFIVPLLLVLVALACAVLAWLALGGYVGTPFGTLSPDVPIAERVGS
jgi:hypothetical protein